MEDKSFTIAMRAMGSSMVRCAMSNLTLSSVTKIMVGFIKSSNLLAYMYILNNDKDEIKKIQIILGYFLGKFSWQCNNDVLKQYGKEHGVVI